MLWTRRNWLVMVLSAAGVIFILLGLMALALPTSYEGFYLWELDSDHSFRLMDAVGALALGLGVVLNWLGGTLWKHLLRV